MKHNIGKWKWPLLVLGLFLSFHGCAFVFRVPIFAPPKVTQPDLYRGAFHVHSEYSHDSTASLNYLIEAGQKTGLDFIVVTDHWSLDGQKAYREGNYPSRPLLIFGSELSTSGGNLLALGLNQVPPSMQDTEAQIDWIHEHGGFVSVPHPFSKKKHWTMWGLRNIDTFEVYCLSDAWYRNPVKYVFNAIFLTPGAFLDSILKAPSYALSYWDMMLKKFPLIVIGGTNAHLKVKLLGLPVENFILYFQSVTNYVWADEFSEEKILNALKRGNSFIAFELFGPANEFVFEGEYAAKKFKPGDTVWLGSDEESVVFSVQSPEEVEIKLIHNGKVVQHLSAASEMKLALRDEGYYRTELYRNGRLWVISNPIFVKS